MKYTMTEPCDQCPFLIGSGFTWRSLEGHASGEFPCHKACDVDEDDEEQGSVFVQKKNGKTPHCAGALIFLEKQNHPHQIIRQCGREELADLVERQFVLVYQIGFGAGLKKAETVMHEVYAKAAIADMEAIEKIEKRMP